PLLAAAQEAAAARGRARAARSRRVRPSEVRLRAADRHLGAPPAPAADGGRVRGRGARGARRGPELRRGHALAVLQRWAPRPVLVARLVLVRPSVVVPDPRRVARLVTPAGQPAGGARVLFLSGLQIHPTQSGGNLRSFELANALRQHGLEVFVYSLVGRKADYLARRASATQVWPEGTEEYVDRGLLGFLAQYGSYALSLPPVWLTAYLRLAATPLGALLLPRRLRERLAWCDVVVADFPFVSPVFSLASARGRLRVQSTHNVEHHLFGGPGRN